MLDPPRQKVKEDEMKVAKTYVQMKERHQKEVNEFPMMWAFNNDQFAQGMKKLGLQ